LSEAEDKEIQRLLDTASLVMYNGAEAVKVLAGRGVGVRTAARILSGPEKGDDLLREVFEAEKQYAKTRRFWKD
jgi:ATP-dependent Lhr-like helicase